MFEIEVTSGCPPLLDPPHFLKTVTANNNLLSHYREHLLTLEKI